MLWSGSGSKFLRVEPKRKSWKTSYVQERLRFGQFALPFFLRISWQGQKQGERKFIVRSLANDEELKVCEWFAIDHWDAGWVWFDDLVEQGRGSDNCK